MIPPDRMLPDRATVGTRTETVVDGRLVEVTVARAGNLPARYVPREPDDVVYDQAGTVVVAGDLLIRDEVVLGERVDLDNGYALVVSGRPSARRRGVGGPVFYSAPVRDVTPPAPATPPADPEPEP